MRARPQIFVKLSEIVHSVNGHVATDLGAYRARLDVLTEVMPQTSADSWQLRHTLNGKILKGDFSPMFKLKLARKDMQLIIEAARSLNTPVKVAEGALDWYERADAAGHGELDWGAILLVSNPELKP